MSFKQESNLEKKRILRLRLTHTKCNLHSHLFSLNKESNLRNSPKKRIKNRHNILLLCGLQYKHMYTQYYLIICTFVYEGTKNRLVTLIYGTYNIYHGMMIYAYVCVYMFYTHHDHQQ